MVPTRWGDCPYGKGINECGARNVSTAHYFTVQYVQWPVRSPDLSPCDYFLWGYLKSKVYSTRPMTIEDLKQRILDKISAILEEMTQRVMRNLRGRLGVREEWWMTFQWCDF
jgi:hypothetical protein